MIKKIEIEIDGVDYSLPNEITISHYGELMRRFSLSETDLEKTYDLVSVLLNVPYNILRKLDPEKLIELSLYLQKKIQEQDTTYITTFKYKGVEYGGINLTRMSFGEYIDLSNFMKSETTIYMNIHKICSILYRPIIDKRKDKYTLQPYNIEDHQEQSLIFKDLPLKYFTGSFNNLYSYLKQIKKDFVVLFGEEDDRPPKPNETEENESNLPWYKMVMTLTNEDFTKIDYVTSRPVFECFNHLTYIKIKNEQLRQEAIQKQTLL